MKIGKDLKILFTMFMEVEREDQRFSDMSEKQGDFAP